MLIAPLVPQYAVWPGAPTCAEIELTQQSAPPCPSLIICLAASVHTTQVPRTLVSNSCVEVLQAGLVPLS